MSTYTAEELQHLDVKEVQAAIDNAMKMINDPATDWDGMNNAADLMNPATGLHTRIDSKQQYIDTVADLQQRLRQREIMMSGGQAQQQPQYQYVPPATAQTQSPQQGAQVNQYQTKYPAPGGSVLNLLQAMSGQYGNVDIHALHQRATELIRNDQRYSSQWAIIPLDKQNPDYMHLGLVYSYLLMLFVDTAANGTKVVYSHAFTIESSGDIRAHVGENHAYYQTFKSVLGPYVANVDKRPRQAWRLAVEKYMHTTFPETAPRAGGVPGATFQHTDADWQTLASGTTMQVNLQTTEKLLSQLNIARKAITARWSAVVGMEAGLHEFQSSGFTSNFKLSPYTTADLGGHYERADFTITFTAEKRNKKIDHTTINNAGMQSFSATVVGFIDFRRAVNKHPATQKTTYYEAFIEITGIIHDTPALSANVLVLGLMSDFCQDYNWLNLLAIPMTRDAHHQYAAMALDVKQMNGVVPNDGQADYKDINVVRQLLKEVCPAMAGIRVKCTVETTTNTALPLMVTAAIKTPMPQMTTPEARAEYEEAVQYTNGARSAVAYAANKLTNGALQQQLGGSMAAWSLFNVDNTGYKASGHWQAGNTVLTTDIFDTVGLLTVVHTPNATGIHINDAQATSTITLADRAMRSLSINVANELFTVLSNELNNAIQFTHMNYVLWVDMDGLFRLRQALATAGIIHDKVGIMNFGGCINMGGSMLGNYANQASFEGSQFGTSLRQTTDYSGLVYPIL